MISAVIDVERGALAERAEQRFMDHRRLGQLIRGARYALGEPDAEHFVERVRRETGLSISYFSLLKMERGEQEPRFKEMVALTLVLGPVGGIDYFILPTMSAQLAERYARGRR